MNSVVLTAHGQLFIGLIKTGNWPVELQTL